MYPPPCVLQWWRYTQYMLVLSRVQSTCQPMTTETDFFFRSDEIPLLPCLKDYSRHEINTSTSPPSSLSSSSRLYILLCASYNTHDDIVSFIFSTIIFPVSVFFTPTQGHFFHGKNQPSSSILRPTDPFAGI